VLLVVVLFSFPIMLKVSEHCKKKKVSEVDTLSSLYHSVRNPVKFKDEREVPILKMYVYPMRGVRSPHPVTELFVSQYGCMYDRELLLMNPETGKPVTSGNADCVMCLE